MVKRLNKQQISLFICFLLLIFYMMPLHSEAAEELLSLGKPVTVSTVADGSPEAVTDGNFDTFWGSAWEPAGKQFVTIDLQGLCKISKIELSSAPGNIYSRAYFRILASDDASFTTYTELVPQPAVEIPESKVISYTINDDNLYQYVRLERTNYTDSPNVSNTLVVREISVYGNFVKKAASLISAGITPTSNRTVAPYDLGSLTDNNPNTFVEFYQGLGNAWFQMDLGAYYYLDNISIYLRNPSNDNMGKNFRVLASADDPEFADPDKYVELWAEGSDSSLTQSGVTAKKEVTDKQAYRYIRYAKTTDEYLYMSEISVYGTLQELSSQNEGYFTGTEPLQALLPNEQVSFRSTVTNHGSAQKTATSLLVLSEDNRVVDAAISSVQIAPSSDGILEPSLVLPSQIDGMMLSAYVFDSFDNMRLLGGEIPYFPMEEENLSTAAANAGLKFDYYNNILNAGVCVTLDEDEIGGARVLMFITKPAADGTAQVFSDTENTESIKEKLFSVMSSKFDQNGYVSLEVAMTEADETGMYSMFAVKSLQEDSESIGNDSVSYYNTDAQKTIMATIRTNVSTPASFESFVQNCEGQMLDAIDLTDTAYLANKEAVVTRFLAMLPSAPTAQDVIATYKQALVLAQTAGATSIDVNIVDRLVDAFELDMTYYTDTRKTAVAEKMSAFRKEKEWLTIDDVREAFDTAVFLTAAGDVSNSEMTVLVNYYHFILKLDYGEANPSAVNNVLTDRDYQNLSEFQNAFQKSVEDVLKQEEEEENPTGGGSGRPSSGGGGGISGGGGGMGTKFEAAPVVIPQQENSQNMNPVAFADIEDVAWAKEAIVFLSERGVEGKGNGIFAPNEFLKREEGAKMLLSAFEVHATAGTETFADMKAGEWYVPYLCTASRMGYFLGDENGCFGIGKLLSREDFAVILLRVLESSAVNLEEGEVVFSDNEQIASYAQKAVKKLAAIGIINGVGDGIFAPKEAVTRAQAAKMLYETAKYIEKGGAGV